MAFLKKKDPFRPNNCRFQDKNCPVNPRQDCADMGAVYEITCNLCKEPVHQGGSQVQDSKDPGAQHRYNYIGMTSTSVHCRMLGHLEGQRARSNSNPLHRHDKEVHQSEPQTYTTRIIRKERTLLPLSLTEALYIEKQSPGTSLNSKDEGGRGSIVRLRAIRE